MNIDVSATAVKKIKEFQQADPSYAGRPFRISVEAGGCSGLEYKFEFDEIKADDEKWEFGEIQVVMDKRSLPFVAGATIDYQETFQDAGFQVINPNSKGSCGCGKSFGV